MDFEGAADVLGIALLASLRMKLWYEAFTSPSTILRLTFIVCIFYLMIQNHSIGIKATQNLVSTGT